MKLVIEEMFAFVAENADGEGVMGMQVSPTLMMPLVGADMDRVKSLIPYADHISKVTGIPYRILKFTNRMDITEEVKNESKG